MLKQTQGDRQGRTVIKRDTQSDEPLRDKYLRESYECDSPCKAPNCSFIYINHHAGHVNMASFLEGNSLK